MKRTTLSALFITASILAAPVFAAGNICESNLATVNNSIGTLDASAESDKNSLIAIRDKALAAQQAGDDKTCISETTKAIEIIQRIAKTHS